MEIMRLSGFPEARPAAYHATARPAEAAAAQSFHLFVLCSLGRLPAQPAKGVLRFPQGSALADIRSLRGLIAEVLYSSGRMTAKPLFISPFLQSTV
jgi:hypothetical protein